MDDLISRQKAIDVMLMAIDDDWEPDYATDRMNDLPSAQQEDKCSECDAWNQYKNYPRQRWIPVTEQLPEDGKYVLAYSADDDFMTVEARHKFEAFQITHWMPLPEPPKGADDE